MKNLIRAGAITVAVGLMTVSACKENLPVDRPDYQTAGARQPVDLANVALGVSYETETFSYSQIEDFAKNAGKTVKAFETISATPRLDRKSVDVKVYKDGSFEMTTIQLKPERNDLIPAANRPEDTVSPYKTVVANGMATFYDESGRVTGQYKLKAMHFKPMLDMLKKQSKSAKKVELADRVTGYPPVDEEEVMTTARSNNAEIRKDKSVTKIRYDLTEFNAQMGDGSDKTPKYAVQHYDFANKRMLGGEVYDKQTNKLLHRSVIKYKSTADGNTVEQARSESYEDDPATGRRIRHLRHHSFKNMTIITNL